MVPLARQVERRRNQGSGNARTRAWTAGYGPKTKADLEAELDEANERIEELEAKLEQIADIIDSEDDYDDDDEDDDSAQDEESGDFD